MKSIIGQILVVALAIMVIQYPKSHRKSRVNIMVFNAPFNNISVISWWSVLLVEEKVLLKENNRPAASH